MVGRFDHRQHLRFAWATQRQAPGNPGGDLVAGEIAEFAALRAPGLYHETLTRFWVDQSRAAWVAPDLLPLP